MGWIDAHDLIKATRIKEIEYELQRDYKERLQNDDEEHFDSVACPVCGQAFKRSHQQPGQICCSKECINTYQTGKFYNGLVIKRSEYLYNLYEYEGKTIGELRRHMGYKRVQEVVKTINLEKKRRGEEPIRG